MLVSKREYDWCGTVLGLLVSYLSENMTGVEQCYECWSHSANITGVEQCYECWSHNENMTGVELCYDCWFQT